MVTDLTLALANKIIQLFFYLIFDGMKILHLLHTALHFKSHRLKNSSNSKYSLCQLLNIICTFNLYVIFMFKTKTILFEQYDEVSIIYY